MITTEEYIRQEEEYDKTMFNPEFEVGTLWKITTSTQADNLNKFDTGFYDGNYYLKEGSIILIVKRTLGVFYCEALFNEILLGINTAILAGDRAEKLL